MPAKCRGGLPALMVAPLNRASDRRPPPGHTRDSASGCDDKWQVSCTVSTLRRCKTAKSGPRWHWAIKALEWAPTGAKLPVPAPSATELV